MIGVWTIRSLLLFLLPLGLLLSGCEKEQLLDCVKGTGSVVKVERAPGWFHAIELRDHVNLRIVPDSVNKVEIRGGENLVGMVRTPVENGRMTIRNDNTCNWTRSYDKELTVIAHTTDLDHLVYKGSADITTTAPIKEADFLFEQRNGSGSIRLKLRTDTARFKVHTGIGDLTCTGRTGMGYVFNNGIGPLDCSSLIAEHLFVDQRGVGPVRGHVTDELRAIIRFKGDVFYKGDPSDISKDRSGEGRLIKLDS